MSPETTKGTRRYRKRRRAEQERQTRERITEAAVKLHGTVGPSRTTISAVAEEAGVQRATVYHHFPDEKSLFEACSSHWAAANPPPDLGAWASIADPGERLRGALDELYSFFRRTEPMLETTGRDAPLVPAMAKPYAAFRSYLEAAAEALVRGRPERGAGRRRVRAAAAVATSFYTWRSLVRERGLSDREAVAVAVALVESAGGAS